MPNARGMSQFADGGVIASKPYAGAASYIGKQSDYCKACAYDPKRRHGASGKPAGPFNSLYWDFLPRHEARFARNPRMAMAYRSLDHAFLLVTNTWPNDGLRVVVEQPGLEPQESDLRQVGDTPVYAAALQIDGDLPVAISWFDLDGAPVGGPTSVP